MTIFESKPFYYSCKILEHHIDTFGHVNNAITLQILEQARWDFITNGGFGVATIQKMRVGPVILDISVRFKREILLREEIEIESINYWNGKSKIMETHQHIYVFREDFGKQLATHAEFKVGVMDLEKRKLIDLHPDWIKAVGIDIVKNP